MNNNEEVFMGSAMRSWGGNGKVTKTITFCVTEDCNLACKYCYQTGKNHKKKMSFEVAKKAVDYILRDKENVCNTGAVIWDFIGGEPFLEIDLIDKISDYIKQQMFIMDHPWFDAYRFSFASNGILYNTEKVQRYISKNRGHISIGLSVDGNKIKHDLQRVFPNGEGSYEKVVSNVPLWLKQFPDSPTKATFAHDDLPYLKDSIISLWNLGIKEVAANVVFENVWNDGDDLIFEQQLKELGDYIIDNKLWKDYSVRFFSTSIGFSLTDEEKMSNFCGAGQMLAVDCEGNFYPCIRFLDFSLNNRNGRKIGNIDCGINSNKLRPFKALTLVSQSENECINCEVASGCAWCTGCNYDFADTDTIYQRATYVCKMHKANVRANEYFWDRYSMVTGKISPRKKYIEEKKREKNSEDRPRFLQIITNDNVKPHCGYRNWNNINNSMNDEVFKRGIEFAKNNSFIPVILGDDFLAGDDEHVIYIIDAKKNSAIDNKILVYDNEVQAIEGKSNNCILLISKENISKLSNLVFKLSKHYLRVNLVIDDIEKWKDEDLSQYEKELTKLVNLIVDINRNDDEFELNVLTDRLNLQTMCNCDSGKESFALAPNGKIYICPAFYFNNPDDCIGSLEEGINIKNKYLFNIENAPICKGCDAYNCNRCKFLNKKLTEEYNTPSKVQCLISNIERNCTALLQEKLIKENLLEVMNKKNIIKKVDCYDPLDKLLK